MGQHVDCSLLVDITYVVKLKTSAIISLSRESHFMPYAILMRSLLFFSYGFSTLVGKSLLACMLFESNSFDRLPRDCAKYRRRENK